MPKLGLLIIDLQEGFNPTKKLVSDIVMEAYYYDHIVQTKFGNKPNSFYRTALNWQDDGGELVLRFPNALVLDKFGYGLTKEHIQQIRQLNCDQWHLCGLETDACVLACAFSLWDVAIPFEILTRLCASPLQVEATRIMYRQFGRFFR